MASSSMLSMKRIPLLFLCALLVPFAGHAAKEDANEPTNVEANQMAFDDVRQVSTFTGNVVLTKGTLVLKAEKMVFSQDAAGYQYATLYAGKGQLATFRQKRDGGPDLWMEGQAADRIVYNGKTEVAQFFVKAKITLLEGKRATDEVEGDYISYDGKTEFYSVNNTPGGTSKPGAGRIKVIIQPRSDDKGK